MALLIPRRPIRQTLPNRPFQCPHDPDDEIVPLQVFEICLPFATVRKADGSLVTLDVRRYELARLDEGYARRVIRRLRHPKTKKRSKDND